MVLLLLYGTLCNMYRVVEIIRGTICLLLPFHIHCIYSGECQTPTHYPTQVYLSSQFASLVPRLIPPPVFDRLIWSHAVTSGRQMVDTRGACKRPKTRGGEWPGNEATSLLYPTSKCRQSEGLCCHFSCVAALPYPRPI